MNLNSFNRTVSLLLRLTDTQIATTPIVPFVPQKPAPEVRAPLMPLARCTPESAGISSEYLNEYVLRLYNEKAAAQQTLMVLRDGKVLCEAGFRGQSTHVWKNLYSASKSITAIAIGFLMDEHKLKATDKVVDILSKYVTPLNKIRLGELTVKHLLTMTSTVMFNEPLAVTESDWIKSFFNATLKGKMGKTFNYNSLNSYMLSVIVREVSGESMTEFLKPRLFEPLGITDYFWECCMKGYEKGGWGLYMKPEDLAKIGVLIQNRGLWNGHRIISSRFIDAATKRQVVTPEECGNFDYGYQVWVGKNYNSFLFNGMTGQNLLCFKDNGIMVMSNAGNGDVFQQNKFFDITEEFFNKDFCSTLPENPNEEKQLKKTLSDVFKPKTKMPFDLRSVLSGKKYFTREKHSVSVSLYPTFLQVVQNNYSAGTKSISFDTQNGSFFMSYEENDETYCFEIGFKKPVMTIISIHGEKCAVNVLGRFAFDEDERRVFIIKIDFVETPCSRIIKAFYDDGNVTFEFSETPGEELLRNGSDLLGKNFKDNFISAVALAKLDMDFVYYKMQRLFAPVLKGEEL